MNYIENLDRHEDEKRNLAFQVVVGMRDTTSLAAKKQQPLTYEQALTTINNLAPDLYNDVCKLIK